MRLPKASDIIIKGLKRLEYRGYDSAGICSIENNNLFISKCKGKIKDLEKLSSIKKHTNTLAIGHTRWATHGEPNHINAHPHLDEDNKVSIVHNGIIENYYSIKKYLMSDGCKFKSDTDTEVLSQLIGYISKKQKLNFTDSVRLALNEIVGAYGIVAISQDEPDKLIAARLGSPLILGIGESEYFIASDSSPIIDYTRNIIILDEGEMVIISKDGYDISKPILSVNWILASCFSSISTLIFVKSTSTSTVVFSSSGQIIFNFAISPTDFARMFRKIYSISNIGD